MGGAGQKDRNGKRDSVPLSKRPNKNLIKRVTILKKKILSYLSIGTLAIGAVLGGYALIKIWLHYPHHRQGLVSQ
jgi:hypothetical protein